MIAHGDRFCIDDVAYMQAREHFLNPQWQKQVLQTPIEERVKAALELREQSQETKQICVNCILGCHNSAPRN